MHKEKEMETETISQGPNVQKPNVSVFVCANCARSGRAATSAGRPRTSVPEFGWPVPVEQIVIPCGGRIQPEHILKTFEMGADLVTVIACEAENCHYIEGSKRCTRRVEYIRSLLEEIGLGEERLLLFFLPGSAAEDMLLTAGKATEATNPESLKQKIDSIREKTVNALEILTPNRLRLIDAEEVPGNHSRERTDTTDDNEDK